MIDRRKQNRRNLNFSLAVTDQESSDRIGIVADISKDGILLLSKNDYEIGTILSLRIELPEDLVNQQYIEIFVRVIWLDHLPEHDHYEIGCNLIEGDIRGIAIVIEKLSEST